MTLGKVETRRVETKKPPWDARLTPSKKQVAPLSDSFQYDQPPNPQPNYPEELGGLPYAIMIKGKRVPVEWRIVEDSVIDIIRNKTDTFTPEEKAQLSPSQRAELLKGGSIKVGEKRFGVRMPVLPWGYDPQEFFNDIYENLALYDYTTNTTNIPGKKDIKSFVPLETIKPQALIKSQRYESMVGELKRRGIPEQALRDKSIDGYIDAIDEFVGKGITDIDQIYREINRMVNDPDYADKRAEEVQSLAKQNKEARQYNTQRLAPSAISSGGRILMAGEVTPDTQLNPTDVVVTDPEVFDEKGKVISGGIGQAQKLGATRWLSTDEFNRANTGGQGIFTGWDKSGMPQYDTSLNYSRLDTEKSYLEKQYQLGYQVPADTEQAARMAVLGAPSEIGAYSGGVMGVSVKPPPKPQKTQQELDNEEWQRLVERANKQPAQPSRVTRL